MSIKHRLKALAKKREEGRGPLVLPLAAYYRGEPAHEGRRAAFYADCALVYGFENWSFSYKDRKKKTTQEPGYGGRERDFRQLDVATLNIASAPLEWLAAKGRLETKHDEPGQRLVRFTVATKFRDIAAGADYAGLKGQAYDGEGGRGGSGGGRPVTDHMLDCLNIVIAVRRSMHPNLFALLTAVVCRDEWVWDMVRPGPLRRKLDKDFATAKTERERTAIAKRMHSEAEAERRMVVAQLHKAIDKTAVTLRYMTAAEYRKRWGTFTPLWTAPPRPKKRKKPAEQQPAPGSA